MLNDQQKAAASHIDGPLMVIAGPGTGKTQLLSSRVAYILHETDTLPENILCLTFTESAAQNMRERLAGMIGQAAYSVTISTYHSFGSEIIRQYPEFFEKIQVNRDDDQRMERPIDELNQVQIVDEIVNRLPYGDPLLSARYYVRSVVSTISELKQALISPENLEDIAKQNIKESHRIQPALDTYINTPGGLSRKKSELFSQYADLLQVLQAGQGTLLEKATDELQIAFEVAEEANSTKTLTAWKNKWLWKNDEDQFCFTRISDHEKLQSLATIYASYQTYLQQNALYDFNDMILRAIEGLDTQDELRYNLQEKYQYILLDEFQDTNPSQFALVHKIADHPVHEGRPNIMAVGDDDQAIYAFQGADVGNMKKFLSTYRDVRCINLTQNYRSHHHIIEVAHNISSQITDRLHYNLEGIDKTLEAANKTLPKQAAIERHMFEGEASEYAWIAEKIEQLIKKEVKPHEIAVLAPRHALLEHIVPFLAAKKIPVSYEKRENILDTPIVLQLKLMSELLVALHSKNNMLCDQLFPQVLSLEIFNIPIEDIWKINWQHAHRDESRSWIEIGLDSPPISPHIRFFLELAARIETDPLENILDILTGNYALSRTDDNKASEYTSPLKEHFFSEKEKSSHTLRYYEAITHLSVIRSKLRDYQAGFEKKLMLRDFIAFFEMYEAAEQPLPNTHPVAQSSSSVQLMTAYKAKGLEFEHVFLVSAHDDIWGSSSRTSSNKISLPENLKYIRYQGSGEDELIRLLFVAITRSKHGLYITSYAQKDNGKKTVPIKYFNETTEETAILPEGSRNIIRSSTSTQEIMEDTETLWTKRHIELVTDLNSLLKERLSIYKMSPTHLNTFIDLVYGGPEAFIIGTLLRFPQAPSVDGEYGTAVHNTLEWYQNQINSSQKPTVDQAIDYSEKELHRRYISENDMPNVLEKTRQTLRTYLQAREDMFDSHAETEVNFYNEGVVLEKAVLSGKIDRLEVDTKNKTVRIADYKTGDALKLWKSNSNLKSRKYEQQLYFYKFLIEGSNTYRGYRVESARLEFVEPLQSSGKIPEPLYITFDKEKESELKTLIMATWYAITTLKFPTASSYPATMAGIRDFEKYLINNFK